MSKVLGFMKQVARGLQVEGNFGTPAIEAAFSKATRATLAGSTTPAACRFS